MQASVRRLLMPLGLLVLAGCGAPGTPDDGDPPASSPGPQGLEAAGTVTFTFTNVETPGPDVSGDNGCFIDAPDVTRVVNGTVTLTWTPTPTTGTLRLSASSAGEGDENIVSVYADDVEGPSPLALSFKDVAVPRTLTFSVHPTEPGAAYEQTVTLGFALVYEGKPAAAWAQGSCPAQPSTQAAWHLPTPEA